LGTDTVQVPSVVGRTVEEAQRRLLRQKLRSVVVDPRTTGSTGDTPQTADMSATRRFVRRQGRAPNTQVRAGTEIRLFTTEDSTQVPDPAPKIQDSTTLVN
jgi:beta-lactam-binding protein with PASTA domain